MIFLLMVLSLVDVNHASIMELKELPLDERKIEKIYNLRMAKGYLHSIYELREILSPEDFNRIKNMIKIVPPEDEEDWTAVFIEELQERLASVEGPTQSAVDLWQSIALDPMDINDATIEEILLLDRVNLIDAVSAVKYRKKFRKLRYVSDLEDAPYLSSYGFRNMRNFLVAGKEEKAGFPLSGFAKLEYDNQSSMFEEGFDVLTPRSMKNSIGQVISDIQDTSSTYRKRLLEEGWTEYQLNEFSEVLQQERKEIDNEIWNHGYSGKFNTSYGDNAYLGGGAGKYYWNAYGGVKNIGVLKNLLVGDYHYSRGMGLVFDNSPDSRPRSTERINGLFGAANENPVFRARGAAIHLRKDRVNSYLFFSVDKKPGIKNDDGTVNCYYPNRYRIERYEDVIDERMAGGHLGFDLSNILNIPFGTYIGINGYRAIYEDSIKPEVSTIDIPYDGNYPGPSYSSLWEGDKRDIGGIEGRLVFRNFGIQGEIAREKDRGLAYILQSRVLYNNLYVLFHRRHYDVDFDNPYSRGFWEQERFEDTPLEDTYRVIDPLYSELSEYPVPKPEDGYYLETRIQFNRKFTLTRAYVDVWKNLARQTSNLRFQWELEYRPIFPLRFRLKHKYQEKNRNKLSDYTTSRTNELTFRTYVLLSNDDYIGFRVRYGRVHMTQSPRYSRDDIIDGGYLAAFFEHNFSRRFGIKGGIAYWKTDGMSQWIFEDVGLDFLYGDGRKIYVTLLDRLSDNLYLRFKFRVKTEMHPHWGLENEDVELYDEDGEELLYPSGFSEESTVYSGNINITWWW